MDRHIMQLARPGAFLLVMGGLVVLAAPAARAQRPTVGDVERPLGVTASPEVAKLRLRVGEVRRFRVESIGSDVTYRWTLDGRPSGSAMQWTFAPTAAQLGGHRIEVVVTGGAVVVRRVWNVRVEPPRPPRVLEASPRTDTVETPVHRSVRLRLRVEPTAPDETVRVEWTVDGEPAGDGDMLRLRPEKIGTQRVRALATSSLGSAVAREWRLEVTEATTTTTEPVEMAAIPEPPPVEPPSTAPVPTAPVVETTTSTLPAPTTSTLPVPVPTTSTTTSLPAAREEPPVVASRTTVPPPPAPPDAEVRGLLDRYAAAMKAHDVGALRRLGQITSDRQAEAMEGYFAGVRDLDVQVKVLEVKGDGERTTVRFTRRDSFRDPTGRLVTQESPPIEKRVERTADGLRFAPTQ
ncbi:MAG TPA: hypothetical protein VGR62_04065 [Candidatus Binatia bacterium]|nr:hypothetical protein [Candidatus Binatia bacterium]